MFTRIFRLRNCQTPVLFELVREKGSDNEIKEAGSGDAEFIQSRFLRPVWD